MSGLGVYPGGGKYATRPGMPIIPLVLTPSDGHKNTYGYQVDGTHPTGMLSCFKSFHISDFKKSFHASSTFENSDPDAAAQCRHRFRDLPSTDDCVIALHRADRITWRTKQHISVQSQTGINRKVKFNRSKVPLF